MADYEEVVQRAWEEDQRIGEPQHDEQNEAREPKKKKPKLNSFVTNHPIVTAIKLRPSYT